MILDHVRVSVIGELCENMFTMFNMITIDM